MSIAARRSASAQSLIAASNSINTPIAATTEAPRFAARVRSWWVLGSGLGVVLVMVLTSVVIGSAPRASLATPAHDDQILRLYVTALGRQPDADGLAYWSERAQNGEPLVELAREMITLPEALAVSSGDFIVDAYRNGLGRDPEPEGYAHWATYDDPAQAVAHIADSPEAQARTGTLAPPPIPLISPSSAPQPAAATNIPAGWVDAGHGVYLPPVLLDIRHCESKGDYTAANRRSSARGAYQFLRSSWEWYGHADRYGAPTADLATPAQQDEAALLTWQQDGVRPWYASRHCWG